MRARGAADPRRRSRRGRADPRSAARGGRRRSRRAGDLGRPRRAARAVPPHRRDAARPDRRRARGGCAARRRCALGARRPDDRRGGGMTVRTRRELQAAAMALLASMAVGSVLMLIFAKSPGQVWWAMLSRTATEPYVLGQVLYRATGLALTGLAGALALDAGLFNIGAENQAAAGVLGAALIGTALPAATPAVIAIPLCLIVAAAAGGAMGAAIGGLRVQRGANEVITS